MNPIACKSFALISVIVLNTPIAFCQQSEKSEMLLVGSSMPDIRLTHIQYFKKSDASMTDFRGKWLYLDFFSSGCTSCVAAFPGINAFQKNLKDSLQVVLIGLDDAHVRKMYERFRKKENLNLAVTYDTLLFQRFGIWQVPYGIVIDPNGKIKAIINHISEKDLVSVMSGGAPKMINALNYDQLSAIGRTFDPMKIFLIDGNGGPDTAFLFRSLLFPWKPTNRVQAADFPNIYNHRIQISGLTPVSLYQVAYGDTLSALPFAVNNSYGRFWFTPELDLTDTSIAVADYITGKNLYCYSQSVPPEKANAKNMQQTMRKDLDNYFGLKVRIDKRMKPCWNLVRIPGYTKTLLVKDGLNATQEMDEFDGLLSQLIASMYYYNPDELFVNKTDLPANTYIHLGAILSDRSELNSALHKFGLTLEKGEKEVNVIVLSNP